MVIVKKILVRLDNQDYKAIDSEFASRKLSLEETKAIFREIHRGLEITLRIRVGENGVLTLE